MIPQVIKRKIGKVSIIDMNGSVTGLWTSRISAQLERAFQHLDGNPAVLNLRHVTDVDTLGLKSIFQVTSSHENLSILSGSREVMDFFKCYSGNQSFQILKDEEDLVNVYGSALLEGSAVDDEHRGSIRLQTALPVKFSYGYDLTGKECVGIVSNINEKGFYIEYIDILSVEASLTELNPYDIQTLDFTLSLSGGKSVSGSGKVLHWQLSQDQFGIGVIIEEMNEEDVKRFSEFVKLQQESMIYHQKGR